MSVINPDNKKMILTCDGGGIRGLITARCLEKLEEAESMPCYRIFDFMAGTSTGAIIVGLLAIGKKATEVVDLYKRRVCDVFKKSTASWSVWPWGPRYVKRDVIKLLREIFGDLTLADIKIPHIMITVKDTVRGETIFFRENMLKGTGKKILLRRVIEASMSAPIFFESVGRYVDGGVGSYNNPCYQAVLESTKYFKPNYKQENIRVLSFGTGKSVNNKVEKEIRDMDRIEWFRYILDEGMDDANEQQVKLVEDQYPDVDFRRYQCGFTKDFMGEIGVKHIKESTLERLSLDAVDQIETIDSIGKGFAEYINKSNWRSVNYKPYLKPLKEDIPEYMLK